MDWRAIASAVEDIENQAEDQTGSAPLTIVMDSHALVSELSFYDPDDNFFDITNQQLFGRKGLMYAYWLTAREATGRSIVMIGNDPAQMQGNGIDEFLESPQAIRELPNEPRHVDHPFYYRIARAFHGRELAMGAGGDYVPWLNGMESFGWGPAGGGTSR
jgi:hypothetical protein